MSNIKWKPGLVLPRDPDSVRDYTADFTEWLEGETISTVVVTAVNCTAVKGAQTGDTVKVRVSAVTAAATVSLRVTTASGAVEDFTIGFTPQSR